MERRVEDIMKLAEDHIRLLGALMREPQLLCDWSRSTWDDLIIAKLARTESGRAFVTASGRREFMVASATWSADADGTQRCQACGVAVGSVSKTARGDWLWRSQRRWGVSTDERVAKLLVEETIWSL